jgi:endonuclease-3
VKGSYTLLVKLSETSTIEVGSLGEIEFRKGFYAYNGSAFGPGGLKRVERHREKSQEGNGPHWHIDYLLVQENSEMVEVFRNGSDHECELSQRMTEKFGKVRDFGCSDCNCDSHLFYSQERKDLQDFLESFYS